MDWAEIKAAGRACYNLEHLKERKRYWVYLLRCRIHSQQMAGLQKFFQATPLRREVLQGMPACWNRRPGPFSTRGLPGRSGAG